MRLISTTDEKAWVEKHVGIAIQKWREAKRCLQVYNFYEKDMCVRRAPVHYNQYVVLAKAKDNDDLLMNIGDEIDWQWERVTPKNLQKLCSENSRPKEVTDEINPANLADPVDELEIPKQMEQEAHAEEWKQSKEKEQIEHSQQVGEIG